MNTLSNINKIISDLNEADNNKKDYYSNVEERLEKVLRNYMKNLDHQYNQILNTDDLGSIAKELVK